MYVKKIVESTIKDATGYIIGHAISYPVPLSLIEEIVRLLVKSIQKKRNTIFLDWILSEWPKIYYKEVENTVKLLYNGKFFLLPQVLIFDNTKENFSLDQFYFELVNKKFKIPSNIKSMTEESFGKLQKKLYKSSKRYYNDVNLRLISIEKTKKNKVIFKVQPVKYKDFVHTNLLMDARIAKKISLRERLHKDGKLESLEKSPLANHLGINILLFTADGSLILQKRSSKVAFRSRELCSSASGAISILDVPVNNMTLKEMPKLREAFEEIGIEPEDVILETISFLGMTRELIRGGKPEMFFLAYTKLSERQVKERWQEAKDKWESRDILFYHFGDDLVFKNPKTDIEKHQFLTAINNFLKNFINQSSIPLLTNIALWITSKINI